jgi:hypothetical protein
MMVFDRYYSNIPQYTLKGSIDGWYDQSTTQAFRNFTFNLYYCGASNRTLNGLQLLGVKYVMIDNGYGGDATSALTTYESSNVFGNPVYNNSAVTIYEVPNSNLVYASSTMPNNSFGFSQNVNCSESIPGVPQDLVSSNITGMKWPETRISFDVTVNQSSYILISNAYSPEWLATDNGSAVPILVSPPGLPVIQVSTGTHHIVLFYSGAPYAFDFGILSLVTFFIVVGALVFLSSFDRLWNKKRRMIPTNNLPLLRAERPLITTQPNIERTYSITSLITAWYIWKMAIREKFQRFLIGDNSE